jgi:hypothetical protein
MDNMYIKILNTLPLSKCKLKHLLPVGMAVSQKITGVGKNVEKRELFCMLLAMYIDTPTIENSMEVPQKLITE